MVFEGTVTKAMQQLAKKVIKHNKLELRGDYYSYQQSNGDVFIIDIANKTCNCNRFLDKAACKHLTAACIKEKVFLNGQRKKANKNDSDDDNSGADEAELQDDEPHLDSDMPNVCEYIDTNTNVQERLAVQVIKSKRGRPTNAERALRFETGLTETKKKEKPKPTQTTRILRSQNNKN